MARVRPSSEKLSWPACTCCSSPSHSTIGCSSSSATFPEATSHNVILSRDGVDGVTAARHFPSGEKTGTRYSPEDTCRTLREVTSQIFRDFSLAQYVV